MAQAHFHCTHKLFGELFVNYLVSNHNKLNAVAGSQVKQFRNFKLLFYLLKFLCKILLANHQSSQLLQLDMFVRKSDYL